MHTMWRGSISFGLVNVPVRMFAATESKDIKFRYLHKACHTPIQYTRQCPQCEVNVDWADIVRGYEYEPDRFVIFDDEDFEAVNKPRAHTIDITDFVLLSEIDPVYFDKTYYLAPEAAGSKAYRLLEVAMNETGKIAIARTVLRNAETLACVRVYRNVLVMETLFWPDEVRPTAELPNLGQTADVRDEEVTMAITLVNQLARPFEPEKYTDTRREDVMNRIQQKLANEQVTTVAAPERRENVLDLMQALQESIRMTTPPKRTRKRTS